MLWTRFQPPEIVNDLCLCRCVERGQRLVKQQELGICHQRPCQGDALAFSAGNVTRFAAGKFGDPECFKQRHCTARAFRWRKMRQAITHVPFHSHVREQRQTLKHVTHPPFRGRHVNPNGRVE